VSVARRVVPGGADAAAEQQTRLDVGIRWPDELDLERRTERPSLLAGLDHRHQA
jgi:hypothetical protein